jgi:hypothetical protein
MSAVDMIGRLRGAWAPGSAEPWKYMRLLFGNLISMLNIELAPECPLVVEDSAIELPASALLDYSADAFARLRVSPDAAVRARAAAVRTMLASELPRDAAWSASDPSYRGPDGASNISRSFWLRPRCSSDVVLRAPQRWSMLRCAATG